MLFGLNIIKCIVTLCAITVLNIASFSRSPKSVTLELFIYLFPCWLIDRLLIGVSLIAFPFRERKHQNKNLLKTNTFFLRIAKEVFGIFAFVVSYVAFSLGM